MSELTAETIADPDLSAQREAGLRLFALSFTSLFFELMVIRWVPSQVRLVAYYANLMLISSFLGLGVGAMISSRGWRLFRFFAPLLAINVGLVMLFGWRGWTVPVGVGEWRFQESEAEKLYSYFTAYTILILIFISNAIVFIPLGEQIGAQFHRLPVLRAYAWDLGGSLCGTIGFGIFSLLHFSPILGLLLVIAVGIALSTPVLRFFTLPFYFIALIAIVWGSDLRAYWSPYYYITVNPLFGKSDDPTAEPYEVHADLPPPPDFFTMKNPPIYVVHVNQDFYQIHAPVDLGRYDSGSWQRVKITDLFYQYHLPFHLSNSQDRVLVLGSGGGQDVQAALMNGAKHVDAVEIDPIIPKLSKTYNAGAPYLDERVTVHTDDARAFLQKVAEPYDVVEYGFLDSQALFSYGASLRLDGYTYTVESFKRAWELVKPGGVMSISFFAGRPWLRQKLVQMVMQATDGVQPYIYLVGDTSNGGRIMILSVKGTPRSAPDEFFSWKLSMLPKQDVDLATDDWPYLYLKDRSVPRDYAIVIGTLLVVSILSVTLLRGGSFGATDTHFLFMGWGFLLLQTKSIGDCSLYFGTTWLVTTLVITGVLLMVLLANWVAINWIKSFSPRLYLPLFASLLLVLMTPRQFILGQSYGLRLLWTIFIVPLPIFFAGLIFSTTFREGANPSALFGSNLLGATIGGFCEYLGMAIGSQALSYIVIGAYAASLICVSISRPKSAAAT